MKNLTYSGRKKNKLKPFDFKKRPQKTYRLTNAITYFLATFFLKNKYKIESIDLKKVDKPFILLSNHMNFTDFLIIVKALYPLKYNWVASSDAFLKLDFGLRLIGGFPKRRYMNDNVAMIRNIKYCLNTLHQSVVFFPEGHYSMIGDLGPIPTSLPKILKLLQVPILTLKMEGNFIQTPLYDWHHVRKTPLHATLKQIYTTEELAKATNEEIYNSIIRELSHDDFDYQLKNKISIKDPNNACGLEKALYKCPHCLAEHQMKTEANSLLCSICGSKWNMTEFGQLVEEGKSIEETGIFSHIPSWYHWQLESIKKEIEEETYCEEGEVRIEYFYSSKGTIDIDNGYLVHDMNGFTLTLHKDGKEIIIHRPPLDCYSVHVEYQFNNRLGEMIHIPTKEASYFCYFIDRPNRVAKIKMATELMYDHFKGDPNK